MKDNREFYKEHSNGKYLNKLINKAFRKLGKVKEVEPIFIQYIDGLYCVQIGWSFDYVGKSARLNNAATKAVYLYENHIKNENLKEYLV